MHLAGPLSEHSPAKQKMDNIIHIYWMSLKQDAIIQLVVNAKHDVSFKEFSDVL